MNKHSISFVVTTFKRTDLLYQAVEHAIDHPIVTEVLIVDDCSPMEITAEIWNRLQGIMKVRVGRNQNNLGCYHNKKHALSLATNEWCVLADSDNLFPKEYFDRLESLLTAGINPNTVYQPSFAKPHFNFTKFEGELITSGNVKYFLDKDVNTFGTMLNAMNYFVNRDEYLKVWEDRSEPWTADSILQNYNWLKAGNSIYVVPGLEYSHRVHEGSHYKEHVSKTGRLYDDILFKLRRLPEPFNGALPPDNYQLSN